MEHEEAIREVGWVARTARAIVEGADLSRTEMAEYFERKAALLEHIAGTATTTSERQASYDLAARARDDASHLRAGLEWPRGGGTIDLQAL